MDKSVYNALAEAAYKEGISRHVVGAVIFDDSKVLLLQRRKDDFMGGIYEIPSGKVETGETFDSALFREVEEETGLSISKIITYVGYIDYDSKSGERTRMFNFTVNVQHPIHITLTEHDNYAWSRRDELDNYNVTANLKEILNDCWD